MPTHPTLGWEFLPHVLPILIGSMKFSAMLSILVLGAALALMVIGEGETPSAQATGAPTAEPPATASPAPPVETPGLLPPMAQIFAGLTESIPENHIRYLGHDWIEVAGAEFGPQPQTPSPFASPSEPSAAWIHSSHRLNASCRVCELMRVMNEAW